MEFRNGSVWVSAAERRFRFAWTNRTSTGTWIWDGRGDASASGCAPLSDRIDWFGACNFSDGQCLIWAEGSCDIETTVEFLHRIDDWTGKDGREVVVI